MGRPKSREPSLCHHKSSGRAFVVLNNKRIYCGKHGTQESRDRYHRELAEWSSRNRQPPPDPKTESTTPGQPAPAYTVARLIAAFWAHAKTYYIGREGEPAGELDNFRQILRPLKRFYGDAAVADFAPSSLKALREWMIQPQTIQVMRRLRGEDGKVRKVEVDVRREGWSRTYANRQVSRIRQIFDWGVEEELIDDVIASRLGKVKALKEGRTTARENPPVEEAKAADVAKVLPLLPPTIQAMVELEALTGMRPGEVRILRGCDIDTSDSKCWVYKPRFHKTGHHKMKREVYFGRRCIKLIKPLLKLNPRAHLFDPHDAVEWQRLNQAKRRSPKSPKPAGKTTRKIKDYYTQKAYTRAIARACKRAGAKFTPNMLRHAYITKMCGEHGIEQTQALVGHKLGSKITAVYIHRSEEAAKKLATKVG